MNVKLFVGAAALAINVQALAGITAFADSEPQITGAVLNGTTAAVSFSGIEEAATAYSTRVITITPSHCQADFWQVWAQRICRIIRQRFRRVTILPQAL